jgi:transcriptional regulator
MYTPKQFDEADEQKSFDLIRQNGFATLITANGDALEVSHLPLILDQVGERTVVLGHMARANGHWKNFAGKMSTAIFHGPHTYITPNWYVDPMNVPTWNYAVVHVQGTMKLIEDDAGLKTLLGKTVKFYEGNGPTAWKLDVLPDAYLGNLSKGIVGFEMEIVKIESKFKLSQNRTEEDRNGVLKGLHSRTDEMSREVLRLMTERS